MTYKTYEKTHIFSSMWGLIEYIEELMGSEGNRASAKNIVIYLRDNGFFHFDGEEYYSDRTWEEITDEEFFQIWDLVGVEN